MKTKLPLLVIVVLLIAGGATAYWYWGKDHAASDGRIRVSGNIEATETQVAFKIAGRVEERLFDEGMRVEQGEVIAILETADLQCSVDLSRAELKVTDAALAKLLAGSRPEEIAAAKSAWQRAAHAASVTFSSARRRSTLH